MEFAFAHLNYTVTCKMCNKHYIRSFDISKYRHITEIVYLDSNKIHMAYKLNN